MILKRNSMRAAIGYAMFLIVLDLIVALPGLDNSSAGSNCATNVPWSPMAAVLVLTATLPAPAPPKSFDTKQALITIVSLVMLAAYVLVVFLLPNYQRVFTDSMFFVVSIGLLKRVPAQDVHFTGGVPIRIGEVN